MTIQKFDISFTSWLRLLLIVVFAYLAWQLRSVLVLLLVVFIVVQALRPAVRWCTQRGIPRVGAVTLTYLMLIGIAVAGLSLALPPLIDQLQLLAANVPFLISKVTPLAHLLPASVSVQQFLGGLTNELARLTGDVLSVVSSLFGGVVSLLTVLVLSFYLLLDDAQLDSLIHIFVPTRAITPVRALLEKIGERMGGWVRGQVVVSGLMFLTTLLVFAILNPPYALTIATLAGLLEVLPIVGPVITGAIAILIALGTGSWGLALASLVAFTVIQQVEGNFLVPNVMKRAVGLSPAVVIVALLVGGAIAGIPGAVLAVPVAAGIDVLVDEWPKIRDALEQSA